MTRLKNTFENLKKQKKSAFVSFVTAGDPDYQTSLKVIKKLAKNGVDIIELGIPFLDPAGDGPTIEEASKRAVRSGMNLQKVLEMVVEFRQENDTPIILMGYYNPILRYGLESFCIDAANAGVDGLLIVDLPPEEDRELRTFAGQNKIDFIKLVSLTSNKERMHTIARNATGFLYLVSILGITGTKSANLIDLTKHLQDLKEMTDLPVVVGFGIKSKDQIKEINNIGADGVVVGSALVSVIEDAVTQNIDKKFIPDLVANRLLKLV